MTANTPLHVAVGVLHNPVGEVLVSFRDPSRHQGGLWEFPGGKVDPGESVQDALCREFKEELGITPTQYFPFKKILYQYSDKRVLLDVWRITQFSGTPKGLEGQAIKWQPAAALSFDEFPAANRDIVRLLKLPREIPITPQAKSLAGLLNLLSDWAHDESKLIYFQQPQLQSVESNHWYTSASELCSERGLTLFREVDGANDGEPEQAGSWHVQASALMALDKRPCGDDQYFSASCHSLVELEKAQALGADFVFLSPVLPDDPGADMNSLGWEAFKQLAGSVSLPVYAQGRLRREHLQLALSSGGFGIVRVSESR